MSKRVGGRGLGGVEGEGEVKGKELVRQKWQKGIHNSGPLRPASFFVVLSLNSHSVYVCM